MQRNAICDLKTQNNWRRQNWQLYKPHPPHRDCQSQVPSVPCSTSAPSSTVVTHHFTALKQHKGHAIFTETNQSRLNRLLWSGCDKRPLGLLRGHTPIHYEWQETTCTFVGTQRHRSHSYSSLSEQPRGQAHLGRQREQCNITKPEKHRSHAHLYCNS